LSGIGRLAQVIQDEKIDIVHVHSRRDFVPASIAVTRVNRNDRSNPVKLIFHLHLVRKLGTPSWLSGYYFAKNVDKFIAVSDAVRDNLLKRHKQLSFDQVTVVPNGIEFDKYQRDPILGSEIRSEYHIPENAIVIGMVGRLDTKGQNSAIQALGKFNRRNAYLMLVGASGIRGYEEKLKSLANVQAF